MECVAKRRVLEEPSEYLCVLLRYLHVITIDPTAEIVLVDQVNDSSSQAAPKFQGTNLAGPQRISGMRLRSRITEKARLPKDLEGVV